MKKAARLLLELDERQYPVPLQRLQEQIGLSLDRLLSGVFS